MQGGGECTSERIVQGAHSLYGKPALANRDLTDKAA